MSIADTKARDLLVMFLEETFEKHHGIYPDDDDNLFLTLSGITAETASIPVGGRCAALSAQVKHVAYYLKVQLGDLTGGCRLGVQDGAVHSRDHHVARFVGGVGREPTEQLQVGHDEADLLGDLAPGRVGGRLPRLQLAARQHEHRRAALAYGQHPAVARERDRSHDDRIHGGHPGRPRPPDPHRRLTRASFSDEERLAPLTAGGLSVLQTLHALKALGWEAMDGDDPKSTHARVEAMRLAWQDRLSLLGDTAGSDVPQARLLSEAHARASADRVRSAVAAGKLIPAATDGRSAGGTIHLTAADASGNVNSGFNAIVVDGSANVFVGGGFLSINNIARNGLAKINSDGTLDAAWNPSPDAFSSVSALALDGAGNLYVGGSFAHMGGQSRNNIAKLMADGTADTTWDATTCSSSTSR